MKRLAVVAISVLVLAFLGAPAASARVAFGSVPARPAAAAIRAPQPASDPLGLAAVELARIADPDATLKGEFGLKVALSGDTALVSAPSATVGGLAGAGSVYVFIRSGSKWTLQATLVASDAAAQDDFGRALAFAGNTAVVGAENKTVAGQAEAGEAYVFVRSGTTWLEQAKLTAPTPTVYDEFGYRVALSGDTALVSAPVDGDSSSRAGAVYVFTRSGGTWSRRTTIADPVTVGGDGFGWALALSGTTAMVGDYDFPGNQAVYVYTGSGATWSQPAKISDPAPIGDDNFSIALAISGNTALVGSSGTLKDSLRYVGSVYVYTRSGTKWVKQTELFDPVGAAYDSFGYSLAFSGGTAVIGAFGTPVHGRNEAGAAYVYARSAGAWSRRSTLTASDAAVGDMFGASLVLSGDQALVGSPTDIDTVSKAGAAYAYRMPPTIAKLTPASGEHGATVTITGASFGATRGASYVKFGATRCTGYVSWGATKIKVKLPRLAKGKKAVTVRTFGGKSNAMTFRVT